MNKKTVLGLLIILISICAISHASAADDLNNATLENIETQIIEETNVDDSAIAFDNSDKLNAEYGEIQQRIDDARDGDEINITGEYICDYAIIVNKSVTIRGIDGGVTIRDNMSDERTTPFFEVKSPNVVLENIKFVGATFHFGGAISWIKDNGLINNCQFIDNKARGEEGLGGALLMYGNNCKVTNSVFSNNYASIDGGAIAWYGDGGTISGCRFENNEAAGNGTRDSAGTGEPVAAKGWGGALVMWADNFNIVNCNFINNRATFYGGAIGLANNVGAQSSSNKINRIKNCTFNGNSISSDDFRNYASGGAIFSDCCYLIIDECTFTDNHADGAYGGAISLANHNTVNNSYFKGNTAFQVNDIIIYNNTVNITIESSNFVLEYKKPVSSSVYGINETVLREANNNFTKTKLDSRVDFVAGMIFTYGGYGTASVFVEGGSIGAFRVLNHPEAKISFSGSSLVVSGLAVGKYTLRVTTIPDEDHFAVDGDLSITVNKAPGVIKATKATVALKKSGKFSVTIVDPRTGKGIPNMKVTLKIYTGKKVKTVTRNTNAKGVVNYQTSKLAKGNHKVIVSATHAGYTVVSMTSYIKVVKQTALKFKVKKKTLKDGGSLTITVMNKKTKKAMNGVKVKLLIYTGSKLTKTVILKTKTYKKNKGLVGYSTNELSIGKHTVRIEPVEVKYGGTAKSSLTVTKGAKKYPDATFKISGKV